MGIGAEIKDFDGNLYFFSNLHFVVIFIPYDQIWADQVTEEIKTFPNMCDT